MRQRIYELVETILIHFKELDNFMESTGFCFKQSAPERFKLFTCEQLFEGILTLINGEKDPRCLLQCFRIIALCSHLFSALFSPDHLEGSTSPTFVEQIFEAVSCYYPITFHPPPNDPYNITHELLVETLMSAMNSHPALLAHSIPYLLNEFKHPSEDESVYHSIKYLSNALQLYGVQNQMVTIFPSLWLPLYQLIISSPAAGILSNQPVPSKSPQELTMNDFAILEAEQFLVSLCTSANDSNELSTQFIFPLLHHCANSFKEMISQHEPLFDNSPAALKSTLHLSSIQSTVRSVYVLRLISSISVECSIAVYDVIFPIITPHLQSLLLHLSSKVQYPSTLKPYLSTTLQIFHALVSTYRIPMNLHKTFDDLCTLHQLICQYLEFASSFNSPTKFDPRINLKLEKTIYEYNLFILQNLFR
jgi:hypothetical protein